MQKGIIQNDEYLKLAINEDREFVILCEDEKDCNSKRVSLYNARRTFSEADQKRCRIQKMQLDGKWIVRVSRYVPEVFEVINGILVPVRESLKEDSKVMLTEMLGQGMKEDDIIAVLVGRGELKESVEEEIERLSL
ncbi:MAG TPA: hypothetical protein DEO33_03580 [Rikenellaceae bacterium]|nr:hypothetical protein [Rikenellaceae bacterium]